MTRLMDVEQPELSIVFGRTKRRVDELTRGLKIRGFRAEVSMVIWTKASDSAFYATLKTAIWMSWWRQMWQRVDWTFLV